MIARDPSDELRPNAVMDDLVKKIDAGELGDSLDEMLATLRKTVNDYDKHTFDCIEVDIALRRRQFDEAFRAIDELVTRPLHQTHGARPLSRGLVNIYRTLEMMITTDIGPVEEMRLKSSQVRARGRTAPADHQPRWRVTGPRDPPIWCGFELPRRAVCDWVRTPDVNGDVTPYLSARRERPWRGWLGCCGQRSKLRDQFALILRLQVTVTCSYA